MFRDSPEGVTFAVRVISRARQNQIVGVEGDSIKIRLTAPPLEGRANEALVDLLSERLNVSRSSVEIVRGTKSRLKIIRLRGKSAAKLEKLLRLGQEQIR